MKTRLAGCLLATSLLAACGSVPSQTLPTADTPTTAASFFQSLGVDQPSGASEFERMLPPDVIQQADTDHDGTLSQNEMARFLSSQQTNQINAATLPSLGISWPFAGLLTGLTAAVFAGYIAIAGNKVAGEEMHPARSAVSSPPPTNSTQAAPPLLSDGLQLAFAYTPAAVATTKAIVLCPNLGSSKEAMAEYAHFLSNYNVLALDFRNQGSSQGTTSTGGMAESHDVLAAVDYLQKHGNKDIGALGVGMGAVAAIDAAAADSSGLEGIVSDGAYATLASELAIRAQADHLPLSGSVAAGALKIMELSTHLDLPLGDAASNVTQTEIPIFFIQGAQDTTIAANSAQTLWQAASAYHEGPWIVDGAGPGLSHQADPADYERQVLSFFAHALSGSAPAAPPRS